jgi:hypothetical protein
VSTGLPFSKRVSLQVMTAPVPVKRAKRSRTLASATPVSSAISESSRWPYFCRHCRMSIKVSLPLLDAIVAMNPGDELASGLRRETPSWPLVSYEFAESPVRYFGIEVDDALEIAEQTEM